MNWLQPQGELWDGYDFFADRAAQMHSWCGEGDPWTWPATYPAGSRVVLQASAATRDEALALSDKLWHACGRG